MFEKIVEREKGTEISDDNCKNSVILLNLLYEPLNANVTIPHMLPKNKS